MSWSANSALRIRSASISSAAVLFVQRVTRSPLTRPYQFGEDTRQVWPAPFPFMTTGAVIVLPSLPRKRTAGTGLPYLVADSDALGALGDGTGVLLAKDAGHRRGSFLRTAAAAPAGSEDGGSGRAAKGIS